MSGNIYRYILINIWNICRKIFDIHWEMFSFPTSIYGEVLSKLYTSQQQHMFSDYLPGLVFSHPPKLSSHMTSLSEP